MLDRLTGMEVFAKVARRGAFTGAARELGISQASATKHVAALEARLGATLFHRTTRKISLTDVGRSYLERVTHFLAEVEAAETEVAADGAGPRGRLRVAAPAALGVRWIAPSIPEFNRRHPKVVVELGLRNGPVDLADEAWDLAISVGELSDSSLIARKLAPCRMAVCAARSYVAARGEPSRAADLAGHDCLGFVDSRVGVARKWRFGAEGERTVEVSGPLHADDGEALRAAALAGMGIVCLPRYIVGDDIASGALVELELDGPATDFGAIYALHLPERAPPKLRAFVETLAATFSAPYWRER